MISYLRFSRPEQLKGDSKRRQTDGAERWAAENGLTLTDRLEDLGISAFRGANRDGDLAAFLELVRNGTVPAGSTLIIEDHDRLSRQAPEDALELFLSIIRAGVTIVTLIDRQEYRRGQLDMNRLMMSIMRICLAHEESAKKSDRLAKAWRQKRAKIADKPLTRQLPAWLQVRDGKVVTNDKAASIQKVFTLALQGYGVTATVKKLNAEEAACGRKPYWIRSYVKKILHNRQVLGEFQLCKIVFEGGKKTRQPIGEPLTDYYPRIVSDADFYAVASMIAARHNKGGPAVGCVNLFQGIMFSSDGSTMQVINKAGDGNRQYVSAAAMDGRKGAADYVSFPMITLEMGILLAMAEIREFAIGDSGADGLQRELAAAEGKFADVASRIQQLQAALVTAGSIAAVVEVIGQLEREKASILKRRRELEAEIAGIESNNGSDALRELCEVLGRNAFGIADQDQRTRLRNSVRQIIRRIDVTTTKLNHNRRADCVIELVDGKKWKESIEVHVKNPRNFDTIDERGDRTTTHLWDGDENVPVTAAVNTGTIEDIKRLWADGKMGGSAIAKQMNVSTSTVYRHKPEGWKPWRKRGE